MKIILKFIVKAFGFIDRVVLVNNLEFETYYRSHKKMGFPIKKLHFYIENGYWLNLNKPTKFNEKIAYRHLFEQSPMILKIVDKYQVREYVRNIIGEEYLIPLLQVVEQPEDIRFSILPNDYIIKMTHSSGQNIICRDKKCTDENKIKLLLNKWLNQKYSFQKLIWFVQNIPRKIIIEELLKDENNKIPKDYKFFVFDAHVEMIQVDQERFTNHARNLYDKEWNRLDCLITYEQGVLDDKPNVLKEMIMLAEKLSSNFTFMRVDFYCIGSKIYFGELTPCPGGGLENFEPSLYDEFYGKKWLGSTSLIRETV